MASATTRPPFSFPHRRPFRPAKPSSKALPVISPKLIFLSLKAAPISSVDVSKEDKPLSDPEGAEDPSPAPPTEERSSNLDPRRFQERFAVLNTGIYECRSCGYRYDEAAGDPSYPIPPGFQFAKLPDDWRCPTCGAAQSFFESKSIEIAGFAQNQQFGLGGNSLTSGQKALLIYGGLLLGFIFFLSGYFLQ